MSLGTIDLPAFAPATGYISFFTLALYVGGLVLLTPAPDKLPPANAQKLLEVRRELGEAIADSRSEALKQNDQVDL